MLVLNVNIGNSEHLNRNSDGFLSQKSTLTFTFLLNLGGPEVAVGRKLHCFVQ